MYALKLSEEEKINRWINDPRKQVEFLTEHTLGEKLKWYIGKVDEHGKWSNRSYTKEQLLNLKDVGGEAYITLLPFRSINGRIRRREENVAGQQMLWCDLDFGDPALAVDFYLNELDRLPVKPSAILMSGRGCWLEWRTEPIEPKKWQKLMKEICWQLREFNSDIKATDRPRYHRLVGTTNPKSSNRVSMMILTEQIYTIEDILRGLGKSEEWLEGKNTIKPKKTKRKPTGNLTRLFSNYSLELGRAEDLFKWLEMRDFDIRGTRNEYLHLVANFTKRANQDITKTGLTNAITEVNRMLVDPVSQTEIRKIVNMICKKTYQYRNTTIIGKLGITEGEQQNLSTIIGKTEKANRAKERMMANRRAKGQMTQQEYKQKLVDDKEQQKCQVRELLEQGHTKKAIQDKLQISRTTLYRICKDLEA